MNYQPVIIQLPLVKEGRGERVRTPEDVAKVCSDIRNLAQEVFHVLSVDSKNQLMDRHMVSMGLVDASLVHPREVFRRAIETGAAAIILCHNHPSGDPSPSAEDIRITKQLVESGRIVDIKVLDHVILGAADKFVSLRESGMTEF